MTHPREENAISKMSPFSREFSAFLAVGRELNLTRAAEKLGIQQAGLTKTIQKLEKQLGAELFFRSNTGLVLTPTGRSLFRISDENRAHWDRLLGFWQLTLETPSGEWTFGCHEVIGAILLPRLFKTLLKEFPGVSPVVHFDTSPKTVRAVLAGRVDFGFVAGKIQASELVVKKLFDDAIALYSGEGQHSDVVFYNDEMLGATQALKRIPHSRAIAVRDYRVAGESAAEVGGWALLPKRIGDTIPGLRLRRMTSASVPISLIYHRMLAHAPSSSAIAHAIHAATAKR